MSWKVSQINEHGGYQLFDEDGGEVGRYRDGVTASMHHAMLARSHRELKERAEAAEAVVARLLAAGINAVVTIKGLAEQQAMADESYRPGLEDLEAAIEAAKQEGSA